MSKTQRTFSFQKIALSTLGPATAMLGSTKIDTTRLQGVKKLEIFGRFSYDGKTTLEGPVYYGFSAGMAIAEIAALFAADPQDQDDDAGDAAMHKVMVIGEMQFVDTVAQDSNDKWFKFKWPQSWVVREGEDFSIFAFNRDSGALTTGATLRFDGMFNYEWRQD